jgi:hypothetical protein
MPAHDAGSVTVRRCTPVGLAAGTLGGGPGNGIWMFVYCGRSWPCMVQQPGTSTPAQPSVGPTRSSAVTSSGEPRSRNAHRPSRGTTSGRAR